MIRRATYDDLEAVNSLLRQVLKVHHDGRPDLFRAEGKKYTDSELLAIFSNPDTPQWSYCSNPMASPTSRASRTTWTSWNKPSAITACVR
jgi:hypothetical protein